MTMGKGLAAGSGEDHPAMSRCTKLFAYDEA